MYNHLSHTLITRYALSPDLLVVPPGFERGVVFEQSSLPRPSAPLKVGGVISLTDIMARDDVIFDDDDETDDGVGLNSGESGPSAIETPVDTETFDGGVDFNEVINVSDCSHDTIILFKH